MMISVLRFEVDDDAEFANAAMATLGVLAVRPGYLGGRAARATDDPRRWVLTTEWRDVGSYRRALGNYDVKIVATPLLAQAIDPVSAFEVLLDAAPGESPVTFGSDRDPLGSR